MEIEIGRGKKGRRAYGFDDIAIVPSRRTRDPDDIDITWALGPYRFELPLLPAEELTLNVPTSEGVTRMDRVGCLRLPPPLDAVVDVWWLRQYGGGLLLPLRDGTAGKGTYGGGRYLLDTAKGADLGGSVDTLVVDLNFLYHPSCRYDARWQCPLAPAGNVVSARIEAGEQL